MTFKNTYVKLTIYYVLVIMSISLVFSFAIYRISSRELNRGLGKQATILKQSPAEKYLPRVDPDFEKIIRTQFIESRNKILSQLIYYNLLILLISAIGSYYLAKKTLKPVEEMVDAQNRFTADASHELKTPLAAMRTEIEVSLRDKNLKPEEAKDLLQSNLEEISKLEYLSNALLKLARYQEEFKLDFQKLALSEIITGAYEKIESLAKKKEIEFQNTIEDIELKGDKQSLIELFVILFDNAIKYSPEKSKVYISSQKEGEKTIVKIKDEGIGIKASDLPYIFNRFYRADSSRSKEKVNGYGLGLSIAKSIAVLHDGNITVTSQPARGSEFRVKI